jgi:hypothetical protein
MKILRILLLIGTIFCINVQSNPKIEKLGNVILKVLNERRNHGFLINIAEIIIVILPLTELIREKYYKKYNTKLYEKYYGENSDWSDINLFVLMFVSVPLAADFLVKISNEYN